MILEIDILLSKGTVTKGYRQTCGSKKDSTVSDFKEFEKEKYRLIRGSIPRCVRTELNKAVKNGILGHFKKDGLVPECYYFISFENEARNAITNKAMESIENIAKVLV